MNHVVNLIARHYQDKITITILQKGKVLAQTDLELASLGLSSSKTKSLLTIVAGP